VRRRLKNGNRTGNPDNMPLCGARHDRVRLVNFLPCPTAYAACTAAHVIKVSDRFWRKRPGRRWSNGRATFGLGALRQGHVRILE
jgi:hypothetical protein